MILTIDEAIRHCEEVAEENEKEFRLCPYPSQECSGSQDCRCLENGESKGCLKCAAEHKQLVDWLKELKELRERKPCEDAVSRKWLLECVNEGWIKFDTEKDENRFIHLIRDIAPSVQLEKINCSEKPNSSDDLIRRRDAIDAMCSVCGNDCDKSKFVYDAPQWEQVILCPEHYALTVLPSVQPDLAKLSQGLWAKTCLITDSEGLPHQVIHTTDIRIIIEEVTGWMI